MRNIAFLTTTMQTRRNGPGNFAMNVFQYMQSTVNSKYKIHFFSEDIYDSENSSFVKTKFSNLFKAIGMLIKPIEYSNAIKNLNFDLYIWNFSVLAWVNILTKKNKNIVFVNDPFSLDCKFEFTYNFVRYRLFRIFERYTCRKANLVITNSEVLKKQIIDNYNVEESKVVVMYKGVDFSTVKFYKDNYVINKKEAIKIGYVKSNYKSGGFELLCDSLLLIKDLRFEIHVAGPKEIDTQILNKYLGKNISIILHGMLTRLQINELLVTLDIYCVPFIKEAFGQANIEAMSMRVPTIILPTDIQVLLHNKEYCWLPDGWSKYDISGAILDIINSEPEIRKEKCMLAHTNVKQKYSHEATMTHFFQIVERFSNE